MVLGRVIGTVVATQKSDSLTGRKLMMVRTLDVDLKPTEEYFVAVDAVGCGNDEVVLCSKGSSARQTPQTKNTPSDMVILGIVDYVDIDGQQIFKK